MIIIYRCFWNFIFLWFPNSTKRIFDFWEEQKKYIQISTPLLMFINGSEVLLFFKEKLVVVVFFWRPILSNLQWLVQEVLLLCFSHRSFYCYCWTFFLIQLFFWVVSCQYFYQIVGASRKPWRFPFDRLIWCRPQWMEKLKSIVWRKWINFCSRRDQFWMRVSTFLVKSLYFSTKLLPI